MDRPPQGVRKGRHHLVHNLLEDFGISVVTIQGESEVFSEFGNLDAQHDAIVQSQGNFARVITDPGRTQGIGEYLQSFRFG